MAPRSLSRSPSAIRAPRVLHKLRKSLSSSRRGTIICILLIVNLLFLLILTAPEDSLPTTVSQIEQVGKIPGPPLFLVPPILTPLQEDVKNVTRVIYREYMDRCMGKDELVPVSGTCEDWFGIGLTVLDSLDTLLLMGLKEEYDASRAWAEESLDFGQVHQMVSMFEIVIRALGGLNSAFELTGDELWREKAVQLGDLLLPSLSLSASGCPPPDVWLGDTGDAEKNLNLVKRALSRLTSNPAEAGTLQLEFRTLSRLSKNPKYAAAIDKCQSSLVDAADKSDDGLATDSFDIESAALEGSRLTIAGLVDSFYEMLLKSWVAFGKRDVPYRTLYEKVVLGIHHTLVRKEEGHVYVGEMRRGNPSSFKKTMDHLACFFPGNLAYAALHGLGGGVNGTGKLHYMSLARDLAESCYLMTRGMYHGLAGEVSTFAGKEVKPASWQDTNMLRPEIVEALYYLDEIDPMEGKKYKGWGETMWKSIREFSQVRGKADGLLSSTNNLLGEPGTLVQSGKLHSFAIAETLKYFFLLFDEREKNEKSFPLTKWVYNTEAHPVRIVNE